MSRYPDHDKEYLSLCQSNHHRTTKLTCTPCVGQNNSTKSVPYKHTRKFCAQSYLMVGLTLQGRKRKYGLSES